MSRLLPAIPSCLSFYRDERDPDCEECDSEGGLACREECDSDDEQHGRCVVVVHHSNVCARPCRWYAASRSLLVSHVNSGRQCGRACSHAP